MTFIGLVCILALVGVVVYAGIRLTPIYLNYMKVARTMEMTASEIKGDSADPGHIRNILERHWKSRIRPASITKISRSPRMIRAS